MPVTSRLKKKTNQLLTIVLTGKPHGNSTFVVNAISRASAILARNTHRAGCSKDTKSSSLVQYVALAQLVEKKARSGNKARVYTGCHEYFS